MSNIMNFINGNNALSIDFDNRLYSVRTSAQTAPNVTPLPVPTAPVVTPTAAAPATNVVPLPAAEPRMIPGPAIPGRRIFKGKRTDAFYHFLKSQPADSAFIIPLFELGVGIGYSVATAEKCNASNTVHIVQKMIDILNDKSDIHIEMEACNEVTTMKKTLVSIRYTNTGKPIYRMKYQEDYPSFSQSYDSTSKKFAHPPFMRELAMDYLNGLVDGYTGSRICGYSTATGFTHYVTLRKKHLLSGFSVPTPAPVPTVTPILPASPASSTDSAQYEAMLRLCEVSGFKRVAEIPTLKTYKILLEHRAEKVFKAYSAEEAKRRLNPKWLSNGWVIKSITCGE